MMGKQLSMYDLGVADEPKYIVAIVERPNGTTFEQKIELKHNESPKEAIKRYQKQLGDPYGWMTQRGRRIRYLKHDAYLIVSYYELGGDTMT